MVQVLKIEKNGDINYINIDTITELYKKCGFRKDIGFDKITSWKINEKSNNNIELWGRTFGKKNLKNTYKFPESLNKKIYGNCSIIYKEEEEITNLTQEIWNKIYIENKFIPYTNDIHNIISDNIHNKEDKDEYKDSHNENNEEKEEKKEDEEDEEEEEEEDDDDDDTISDMDCISLSDNSELEEESYIYSSEEEI